MEIAMYRTKYSAASEIVKNAAAHEQTHMLIFRRDSGGLVSSLTSGKNSITYASLRFTIAV